MRFIRYALSFCVIPCAAQEQYQDIIVNNEIVAHGVRDCSTRYQAIKGLLDKFQRPFTFLDIGAESGYFTFKTAYEYPHAVGVMIEDGYSDAWDTGNKLLELCRRNTSLKNIILLKKRITAEDLELLAECEHFDVVYAFNIIHHFGKNWRRAADAIFKLAQHTIIESPPSQDKVFAHNDEIAALEEYLKAKNGTVLARTPRHTDPQANALLIHFETPKTDLVRKHWFFGDTSAHSGSFYSVHSDFSEKIFVKNSLGKTTTRHWQPGINFITFKALSGVWPHKFVIGNELLTLHASTHGDLFPWNIVINGNHLHTIDDDGEYMFNPTQSLLLTYGFAFLERYDEIRDYILTVLYSPQRLRSLPIEVAYGELIDKISILEIKMRKTANAEKLAHITKELAVLQAARDQNIAPSQEMTDLTRQLAHVNEKLWDIEDAIREKERAKTFDDAFIALARSVYLYNDERARIKRAINEFLKSGIIEEKIYAEY